MVAGSMMMPALVAEMMGTEQANQYAPQKTHFYPRAKLVIFINLSGGVSHLDQPGDRIKQLRQRLSRGRFAPGSKRREPPQELVQRR